MAEPPVKPPTPPSPPRDDEEIAERRTFRDYYIILRERLWIALPLAVLVAVGYGYRKLQVTPTYEAVATMQFDKPDTVIETRGVRDETPRSDVELNTHISVLGSGKIRQRVIASFTPEEQMILKRARLKAPGATAANINVADCIGNVMPYSNRATFIVTVRVTHEDPEAAALVANRYVETYYRYLVDNTSGATDEAVKLLNENADRLGRESEAAEAALQAYIKEYNLISLDSTQNLIGESLRRAGTNREDARLRVRQLEDKIRQIEEFQAAGKNLLEISDIGTHAVVSPLAAQLRALQQDQLLLSERYLERHYKMVEVASKIAVVQADLDKAIATAIAEIRTRLAEAKQALDTANQEYERAEKASMHLGDVAVNYRRLQSDAEIKKNSYQQIVARLNDTRTVKNIEKVALRTLDRAGVNPYPVSPNKRAITNTCVGIGVIVFFAVAVGLSFIDDRVKSAWDVESFIGVNLLGIIPDLAAMKDDEKYNLVLDGKQAPGTEAFLSVYSSIKIHSKLDFPKSVLVTSTIPGEGKTLISCNIAGCFARHGKRTLLIDCDLRRPMLHRHFKQQNNAGLLPWFESGGVMEGDLATNPTLGIIKVGENLSLLCSGGRSKSPTELLENPLFGQLLERLKREYDLVIVDSPPLGAVTDSLLIAERIDEVIYVCRFNRAYRKHIRLYMRALRNGKNEVLGVVLNGLSPRRIEYYSNYRYYRSYKKYYGAQT